MNTEAAFLAAICAAPEDDTPRLVYADWLEENAGTVPCPDCLRLGLVPVPERAAHMPCTCRRTGRVPDGRAARAEFIRVQCELASPDARHHQGNPFEQVTPCPACIRYQALRRRERELLKAHRGEWFRLLSRRPGFGENEPLRWWPVASNEQERRDRGPGCPALSAAVEGTPRRGFLDSITLDSDDWLAHGKAVVACQPVTGVRLSDREPERLSGMWAWHSTRSRNVGGPTPYLPEELFRLLPRIIGGYQSEADALAALSAACLEWARSQSTSPATAGRARGSTFS